jgi:hypothetical protein
MVEMGDQLVKPTLESDLLKLGYRELFLRQSNAALEQIWSQPDAPQQLRTLALDPQRDPQARLLAAEILFLKDPRFPPPDAYPELAALYCHALETATSGNSWVLPGNTVGTLGKHLLNFGAAAVPHLQALLSNQRVIPYEGSEEATIGNRLKLRVQDLAAYFISHIHMRPFPLDTPTSQRDAAIRDLQASLHP